MRITTNPIGNYAPARVANKPAPQPAQQTKAVSTETNISDKEKQFFANMYPDNKSEIMKYHFYQKNGRMSGVAVGSLFDRRG